MGMWMRDWRYTSVGSQNYYRGIKITSEEFEKTKRSYRKLDNAYALLIASCLLLLITLIYVM